MRKLKTFFSFFCAMSVQGLRQCYTSERLEDMMNDDLAAGYAAGLGCYVSGAWRFFCMERARLPAETGRLEIALPLQALVKLTKAVAKLGSIGGNCRQHVLSLMRSGDVRLDAGFGILSALWSKDRGNSKQWLRELVLFLVLRTSCYKL